MISVGFLVLLFTQILIYFFSFLHQGHMDFIAISESTIFTFPQNFSKVFG